MTTARVAPHRESPHCESRDEMSSEAVAQMERYAFDYGQTFDSSLVTEAGRE